MSSSAPTQNSPKSTAALGRLTCRLLLLLSVKLCLCYFKSTIVLPLWKSSQMSTGSAHFCHMIARWPTQISCLPCWCGAPRLPCLSAFLISLGPRDKLVCQVASSKQVSGFLGGPTEDLVFNLIWAWEGHLLSIFVALSSFDWYLKINFAEEKWIYTRNIQIYTPSPNISKYPQMLQMRQLSGIYTS